MIRFKTRRNLKLFDGEKLEGGLTGDCFYRVVKAEEKVNSL